MLLNKVYDWSKTWQLRLASDKCQHCHISLSPRPQPFDYFVSDFKLHRSILEHLQKLHV